MNYSRGAVSAQTLLKGSVNGSNGGLVTVNTDDIGLVDVVLPVLGIGDLIFCTGEFWMTKGALSGVSSILFYSFVGGAQLAFGGGYQRFQDDRHHFVSTLYHFAATAFCRCVVAGTCTMRMAAGSISSSGIVQATDAKLNVSVYRG